MAKAGRKGRYETHVQPRLNEIKKWIQTMNEKQIAKRLGISEYTFNRYKGKYEDLQRALLEGAEELKEELKDTLKKKAKGYYYTETTTTQRRDGNSVIVTVEKRERYAQPDTGAIHLLLKNLDPTWRNDDAQTLELKKRQTEIAEKKAEAAEW